MPYFEELHHSDIALFYDNKLTFDLVKGVKILVYNDKELGLSHIDWRVTDQRGEGATSFDTATSLETWGQLHRK